MFLSRFQQQWGEQVPTNRCSGLRWDVWYLHWSTLLTLVNLVWFVTIDRC